MAKKGKPPGYQAKSGTRREAVKKDRQTRLEQLNTSARFPSRIRNDHASLR